MIWTEKPTLEQINQRGLHCMLEHLGIVFTEIGDDSLCATMPVDQRTKQPAGLLHGGASVVLAESVGSVASALCIDSTHQMPVGIEVNANHLKSVSAGIVTAKGTPLRLGKSLHVWNIDIRNAQDELVCVSRLTVMIINKR